MKGYYKYDGEQPDLDGKSLVDVVLVNGIINNKWTVGTVQWGECADPDFNVAYWRPAGQPVDEDLEGYRKNKDGIKFPAGTLVDIVLRSGKKIEKVDCSHFNWDIRDQNDDILHWRISDGLPNEGIVNHPPHYTGHPSGTECIEVTEHMNFCRGNAMKYLWRAGEKGDEIEDLKKARWYIDREIRRLEKLK